MKAFLTAPTLLAYLFFISSSISAQNSEFNPGNLRYSGPSGQQLDCTNDPYISCKPPVPIINPNGVPVFPPYKSPCPHRCKPGNMPNPSFPGTGFQQPGTMPNPSFPGTGFQQPVPRAVNPNRPQP